VPPLEGSITYRSMDDREYAVGIVEGWVPNSGDGWHHVIGRLESAAAGGIAATSLPEDCRQLGTTTADLHLALASDATETAFAPEPVTADHVAAWHHEVQAQADRTLDLLVRVAADWPAELRFRADALLAARAGLPRQVRMLGIEAGDADFRLIRVHGDFHLGQTLKTAGGFVLIDFEGEPLKPLALRRMKQCALKDVAGMLRSIDYAAADVQARYPAAPPSTLDTRVLRRAFCDSYLARSRERAGVFLPAAASAIDPLVALFELEKALYELDYEINNRPHWAHIPLGAVTRLLGIAA
jgi:maltose alpha-D-glucosyltransferase / alpha-amylase